MYSVTVGLPLFGCGSFVRGRKRKKVDLRPFILSRRLHEEWTRYGRSQLGPLNATQQGKADDFSPTRKGLIYVSRLMISLLQEGL